MPIVSALAAAVVRLYQPQKVRLIASNPKHTTLYRCLGKKCRGRWNYKIDSKLNLCHSIAKRKRLYPKGGEKFVSRSEWIIAGAKWYSPHDDNNNSSGYKSDHRLNRTQGPSNLALEVSVVLYNKCIITWTFSLSQLILPWSAMNLVTYAGYCANDATIW